MDCQKALRIITNKTIADEDRKLHQQALSYVMANPDCLAQVDQFARAILSTLDDDLPCAEARVHLASYYELSAQSQDLDAELSAVHDHIARCPYCQLEYQMLQTTMHEVSSNALPMPESVPDLDFSFLGATSRATQLKKGAIWQVHDQVCTLFTEINVTLSQIAATIAPLGEQLTPAIHTTSLRADNAEVQFAVLVLPDEEADVHFQIETRPFKDGTAMVTIKVTARATNKPIPHARVALRYAGGNLVAGALAGPQGSVEFTHIAAAEYIIQVRIDDQRWELPIAIARV